MGHLPELDGFDAACRDYLRDLYPGAALSYQVYLPDSQRIADFVAVRETPADFPNVVYVVETEDDFSGVISSVGQVQMYAGHFERGVPVLLYPEDHGEQPELRNLRRETPVLLLEVPASYEPDGREGGGGA